MSKSYEDDPIKDRAREAIYKYADQHLPKNRENSSAVYLSSDNNKESLILDRLGIPRSHRIILESDKNKVAKVRSKNPEIGVLPISTEEFFSREAQNYPPFWYCGLDYECTLNENVLSDIKNIAKNGNIIDGGVIYTNIVGTHEQLNKKSKYAEYFFKWVPSTKRVTEVFGSKLDVGKEIESFARESLDNLVGEIPKNYVFDAADLDKFLCLMEQKLIKFLPEDKLQLLRSYAIIQAVQHHLIQEPDPPYIFNNIVVPGADKVIRRILMNNEKRVNELKINDLEEYVSRYGILAPITGQKVSTLLELIEDDRNLNGKTIRKEGLQIEKHAIKYFRKSGMGFFPYIIRELETEGYVITDRKSFSYTSSRNTQMMLDVMNVRRINPRLKLVLEDMLNEDLFVFYTEKKAYLGKPWQGLESSSLDYIVKRLSKESRDYVESIRKEVGFLANLDETIQANIHHQRIWLGSGFLQPITLNIARKCILEGLTDEEISQRYQIRNWRRIAALRANLTRGRINRNNSVEKENKPLENIVEEKKEENNLPRNLIPRNLYRNLPDECQIRIGYFIREILDQLSPRKNISIRKAFYESDLRRLIEPSVEPIRFYAFFDDISLEIAKNKKITSDQLNEAYRAVIREDLVKTTPISYKSDVKEREIKVVSDNIKLEVRELILQGIPKEEIWEAYKNYFTSRKQFGAVIAWASPNLSKKINNK
ncbi:MAG TPA: hypothetical protein VI815_01620 [Candidatus Nanoarchaeia archaeon]|nr:hypothetical protein [Candidatus Nanoarchaeia archaeon]